MEARTSINVSELNQLFSGGGVTVIDVRSAEEYRGKRIPFALNVPIGEIESGEAHIDKDKTIVTVCGNGGGRSARAAGLLREKYAAEAYFLEDGTFGWLENESRSVKEELSFFQRFMRSVHLPGDTDEEKLKKTTLLVMAIPFSLAGLLWGLLYFASGLILPGSIPFSYGILSLTSTGLFMAFKQFRVYRFIQLILILLLPLCLQVTLGGLLPSGSVIVWAIISPLGALFFFSPKQSLTWFAVFVAVVLFAYAINDFLPRYFNWQLSERFVNSFFLMNILGISSIIFMLQYYFVTQQVSLKKSGEQKSLELTEKNREITDSISYAKRIQNAMLANEEAMKQNLNDYFILFKPKDIVSGDFYWSAGRNNRFFLAACDSTGHGVPGAFMSLLNISFLNEAIKEKDLFQPDEIFGHVRSRLIDSLSADGGKDGMDGALVCIDGERNKLSFAAAHNAPILIRNGDVVEFEADKMPVGKGIRQDNFRQQVIDLVPGDLFYLYTDGYPDQFGGPRGKKFRYKQMKALIQSISSQPMQEQRKILEAIIENWKGNLEQTDDILIIGFKVI
jgi:serine phosphatase RsbU (regulator of sigma subunit)/rhodanese-related sulfurtransferase